MVTQYTSLLQTSMYNIPRTHEEGMIQLAKLVFDFAEVRRATYRTDGITPESDTDHTVMVSIIACALANSLYKDELDTGLVAQFAIVHDIVEAYVGDTNTFGITEEKRKLKEKHEERAFHMIDDQFRELYPWLPETIKKYESLDTKEARFVKAVDKVMTFLTNVLNNGSHLIKERMGRDVAEKHYTEKIEFVQEKYGAEFPLIIHFMELFKERVITHVYGKL